MKFFFKVQANMKNIKDKVRTLKLVVFEEHQSSQTLERLLNSAVRVFRKEHNFSGAIFIFLHIPVY